MFTDARVTDYDDMVCGEMIVNGECYVYALMKLNYDPRNYEYASREKAGDTWAMREADL